MPEYDNSNRGALFKNKKKQTDRHPDYNGTLTVGGSEEFWMSGWIKTSKSGETYMSISIQPKESTGEESQDDTPF